LQNYRNVLELQKIEASKLSACLFF
jgi:hypothetical protein